MRAARDWAAIGAAGPAPAIDWERESVLLLALSRITDNLEPVLVDARPDRVMVALPSLQDGRPARSDVGVYVAAYAVPRLDAAATVDYACPWPGRCPPGGAPSPDPG